MLSVSFFMRYYVRRNYYVAHNTLLNPFKTKDYATHRYYGWRSNKKDKRGQR